MASSGSEAPESATTERGVLLQVISPSAEANRLSFPNVPLTTTVAAVKLKIQEAVPSRPAPERQRLIYQGRALVTPSATLETVFGREASRASDTFTLHLVLPPPGRVEPTVGSGGATATTNTRPPGYGESESPQRHGAPVEGLAPARPETVSQPQGLFNPRLSVGVPGIPHHSSHHHHIVHPHARDWHQTGAPTGSPANNHNHTIPPGVPGLGLGEQVPLNDHVRQALAHHMQQHEALHRLSSGHTASSSTTGVPQQHGNNTASSTGFQPRPGTETVEHRNNGNTVVHEGNGPNGPWRTVINQATIPISRTANDQAANQHPMGLPPLHVRPDVSNPRGSQTAHARIPPMTMPYPFPINPLANAMRQFTPPNQHALPPMVYLLSSPSGYQALLVPSQGERGLPPPPTTSSTGAATQPVPTPSHVAPVIQTELDLQEPHDNEPQQGGQDDEIDLLRIVFPLGGHLWLIIRLAGLVYLIAGGATWNRTMLLSALALVVFIGQAGWLTPIYRQFAEPLRRHLDGVIRADAPIAQRQAPQQDQHQADGANQAIQPNGSQQNNVRRRGYRGDEPGLTPAQLAARILQERERQQQEQSFLRTNVRRLERSLALFVGSLIPGVGEGHVAAQQEAEEAQRRREQEREAEQLRAAEQQQQEQQQRIEAGGSSEGHEAAAAAAAANDENTPLLSPSPRAEQSAVAAAQ